jgi:hypothetical protein
LGLDFCCSVISPEGFGMLGWPDGKSRRDAGKAKVIGQRAKGRSGVNGGEFRGRLRSRFCGPLRGELRRPYRGPLRVRFGGQFRTRFRMRLRVRFRARLRMAFESGFVIRFRTRFRRRFRAGFGARFTRPFRSRFRRELPPPGTWRGRCPNRQAAHGQPLALAVTFQCPGFTSSTDSR